MSKNASIYRWFRHFMVWGFLVSIVHLIVLMIISIVRPQLPWPASSWRFLIHLADPLAGPMMAVSLAVMVSAKKKLEYKDQIGLDVAGGFLGLFIGVGAWLFPEIALAIYLAVSASMLLIFTLIDVISFQTDNTNSYWKTMDMTDLAVPGLYVGVGIGISGGFAVGLTAILAEAVLIVLLLAIRKVMISALRATYPNGKNQTA